MLCASGEKTKLGIFLEFCRGKNLKLKPSKLNIPEQFELGGAVISSELVKNEHVVCVLPKDKRVQAFFDLKKPQNKNDIHIFCGILASLQQWNPNIPLNQGEIFPVNLGTKFPGNP